MVSNDTMLTMLEKVQPLQIEILRKNYDVHIDAGVYGKARKETYISFDFTIFDDGDIVFDTDFDAHDTQEELNAKLEKLKIYIDKIL